MQQTYSHSDNKFLIWTDEGLGKPTHADFRLLSFMTGIAWNLMKVTGEAPKELTIKGEWLDSIYDTPTFMCVVNSLERLLSTRVKVIETCEHSYNNLTTSLIYCLYTKGESYDEGDLDFSLHIRLSPEIMGLLDWQGRSPEAALRFISDVHAALNA